MKATNICALFLCLGPLALTATAQKYIDIEADASTMVDGGAGILNGGVTYTLATKNDVGTYVFYPAITTINPLSGHTSDFRFYMAAHPGTTTPGEKMLVNIIENGQTHAPAWNTMDVIGFEVRLGADYQIQTQNMQLAEWWQGSPYGAIAEMIIKPGTTQWAIGIENDTNNTQPGAPAGEIFIDGQTLNIGQWYHFVIGVKPNYTGSHGAVQVWQDGTYLINEGAYYVGYDPSMAVGTGGGGLPMNGFNICVGEYRPANSNDAEIYFDSFRYGASYGDVK
jgi:hypothetical protein